MVSLHRSAKLALALVLSLPGALLACEADVVYAEHLAVDSASNYYLMAIRRAHGDNLTGTIERAFGGALAAGQTYSIQVTETALVDSACPMDFNAGETYLLRVREVGGALQISRYDRGNVPASHPRFETYLRDVAVAPAAPRGISAPVPPL